MVPSYRLGHCMWVLLWMNQSRGRFFLGPFRFPYLIFHSSTTSFIFNHYQPPSGADLYGPVGLGPIQKFINRAHPLFFNEPQPQTRTNLSSVYNKSNQYCTVKASALFSGGFHGFFFFLLILFTLPQSRTYTPWDLQPKCPWIRCL